MENYQTLRAQELGLPEGTGKSYSQKDLEEFVGNTGNIQDAPLMQAAKFALSCNFALGKDVLCTSMIPEAMLALGEKFSSKTKTRTFDIPTLLKEDVEALADLRGDTLLSTSRQAIRNRMYVDLLRTAHFDQGSYPIIQVGQIPIDPNLLMGPYQVSRKSIKPGSDENQRVTFYLAQWENDMMEQMRGLSGESFSDYARSSMAFYVKVAETARTQDMFTYPYIPPVTIGKRNYYLHI
jgi:hypothetical protein